MMSYNRSATHAGSWYTDSGVELDQQLDNWLAAASYTHGPARAIIAPHAGYTYCGECGGYAYRQINPALVKRIFVLGPSHHVRLRGCAVSAAKKCQTPLYDLEVDSKVSSQLKATGHFSWMDPKTDEDEHSIEMHLPYIAKVMSNYREKFTIIPILVGSLSVDQEALYGQLLMPYLLDPNNLFVISSDFCHWGQRFNYTYYEKSSGPIYKCIEKLDKAGMSIIESLDAEAYSAYLKQYSNTICGRHPIGILLQCVKQLMESSGGYQMHFKFLKYAQSSQCKTMNDSSVSYASGSLVFDV